MVTIVLVDYEFFTWMACGQFQRAQSATCGANGNPSHILFWGGIMFENRLNLLE